jgi:hypothetical protein
MPFYRCHVFCAIGSPWDTAAFKVIEKSAKVKEGVHKIVTLERYFTLNVQDLKAS